MRDITAQALALLFQQIPIGVHVYHAADQHDYRALRLLAANPTSARLMGLPVHSLIGQPLGTIFPDLTDKDLEQIAAVARSGEPEEFGGTYTTGGPAGPAFFAFKAFQLNDDCIGLSFEDVTARERAREQDRRQKMFLETLIHTIPQFVFVKDAKELRYVEMNKSGASFIGIPREDIVGSVDSDLIPAELASQLAETDRRILAGKVPVEVPEEVVPNANHELRCLRTVKIPILDEGGEPRYLLGISDDITERKRAEEALKKSQADLLETQRRLVETIRELSTPALPVHNGILVVPLVGHMDTGRSAQLTATLLESIQRYHSESVIIDITGVPVVDTAIANHLITATRASELLGARCVIVGVSPHIAHTIAQIDIDLGANVMRRDLQDGIVYALAQQGRVITARHRHR